MKLNHSVRVLIVDDDEDIRANFSDILDDLGFTVTTACDAEAALAQVRRATFDVALLDFKMPGMDGASLYEEIKKICPSIAAIMITAWAGNDGLQRAIDAGTWDVLRKPVDIPKLLKTLEAVVAAPIVLVVDDDRSFCDSLWQVLNERGFRVALAHSEEDGMRQIRSSGCDVAIVDVNLGAGDGRKVIQTLSEIRPGTRAVVVSGCPKTADEVYEQFGDSAVSAVCAKPVDVDRLLLSLRRSAPSR